MATLVLQYRAFPDDRVELTAEIRTHRGTTEPVAFVPRVCGYEELRDDSRKYVEALREVMYQTPRWSPLPDLAAEIQGKFQPIGEALRAKLMPHDVLQRLQTDHSVRHLLFRVDPQLNGVPFDGIYLWNDFLAFGYATGKELLNPNRRAPGGGGLTSGLPYRVRTVVDPGMQLEPDAVDGFTNRWADLQGVSAGKFDLDSTLVSQPATIADLQQHLRGCELFNIFSHHKYDNDAPEKSGCVIGAEPDIVFTAADLLHSLDAGAQPPRLIFSASCESGVTRGWEAEWPNTTRLYGMVDAALRAGIRHYVCTAVELPQHRSPLAMADFYEALGEGRTVGESLRLARRALRGNAGNPLDAGTLLGLAYVLYGDPGDAYLCGGGHRVDSVPIALCGDMSGGAPCGHVICAQDRGYARQLCDAHCPPATQVICSTGHAVADAAQLAPCKADGCRNVVCPQCRGTGQGLCWEHCCHEGHPIHHGASKTCADPSGLHPGEKRSVCPRDDGWFSGLCKACLAAARPAAQAQSCGHCGAFITAQNPWHGVCAGCGQQLCSRETCGPWHEQTMHCPNTTRSKTERETEWLKSLEVRGIQNTNVATRTRLVQTRGMLNDIESAMAMNIGRATQDRPRVPLLTSARRGMSFLHPRVRSLAELGQGNITVTLQQRLENAWRLPNDVARAGRWCPPQDWLNDLHAVNYVRAFRLSGLWGRPVIVVLAVLTPVDFLENLGPVFTPCNAKHLSIARDAVGAWLKDTSGRGEAPDTYWVAIAPQGWVKEVKALALPKEMVILVEPRGDSWRVCRPALPGMAAGVRKFARRLEPETVHQRMEAIRKWVVEYLEAFEFVTVIKVQDAVETTLHTTIAMEEVLFVFDLLEEEGKFRREEVNGKDALRVATPAERAGHRARRSP